MKVYISTSLPYVNAEPHIGFALEIIQADCLARHLRNQGHEVMFVTGTDENSFKIARAAADKRIDIQQLVDINSKIFSNLKDLLSLTYDKFLRTTENKHKKGAQKLFASLNPEDIYIKKWSGYYCVPCEVHYGVDQLLEGELCPEHLRRVDFLEEDNYFFRVENYRESLRKDVEKKIEINPIVRRLETLDTLSKFEDFNISRLKKYDWGVEVPDDGSRIIYPWVEALSSYINIIGYADDAIEFEKWWADNVRIIHIVGRGITNFHTIYWPLLLKSAGLKVPDVIFSHPYITSNGQKISKTLGNTVDPFALVEKYGSDKVRYYLLSLMDNISDNDFSVELLDKQTKRFFLNIENLITEIEKNKRQEEKSRDDGEVENVYADLHQKYLEAMQAFDFQAACLICNKTIQIITSFIKYNSISKINIISIVTRLANVISTITPDSGGKILNAIKKYEQ